MRNATHTKHTNGTHTNGTHTNGTHTNATTYMTIYRSRQRDGWRYGLYENGVLVEGGFVSWADADRARDEVLLQRQVDAEQNESINTESV